jgi:DNA-binding transcriptional ArsR family regulator
VPRYLEEVDPGLSAEENIRRLCFRKEGVLFKDFDAIFNSMFGNDVAVRRKILGLLAEGPMSGAEIAERLDMDRNGALSARLKELAEGGFIDPDTGLNPETGEEARVSRYRLRDNYTRFYLKYIEPRKGMIMRGSYRFASLSSLPDWNAVMGLQFENLIVNNAMELVPYLGMGNSTVESAAPYRNVRKGRNGKGIGCQIDLLVQTPRAAYVVEIKRRNEIGAEIEKEVAERMKRLPLRRGMSKRPVLVCDGHVDTAVEADGFFSAIIQGRRLLGI